MNEEIAKKWVSALRSGKFQQGPYNLRGMDDRFCCLGVLCQILETPIAPSYYDPTVRYQYGQVDDASTAYLPNSVLKLTGMKEGSQPQLQYMNDAKRLPFTEIADFIEANWSTL